MRIARLSTFVACASLSAGLVADENPKLIRNDELWLHVPSAEYLDAPGYFHNAYFRMEPSGLWSLVSYETGVQVRSLTDVAIIKTAELPVQIFLKVAGIFTNGCQELGEIDVAFSADRFTVGMHFSEEYIHPEEPVECTTDIRNFSKLVPLPVYGLEAGEYTFVINTLLSGTFTLSVDNVVPQ